MIRSLATLALLASLAAPAFANSPAATDLDKDLVYAKAGGAKAGATTKAAKCRWVNGMLVCSF